MKLRKPKVERTLESQVRLQAGAHSARIRYDKGIQISSYAGQLTIPPEEVETFAELMTDLLLELER